MFKYTLSNTSTIITVNYDNCYAIKVMVFSTGGLICDEFDAFLRKVGTIISTKKNKRGMVKKMRQKVHWLIVNNVHSTLRESGKIYLRE